MNDSIPSPSHTSEPLLARRQVLSNVAAALRLSTHVLDRSPSQLESQLRGRLSSAAYALLHDAPTRHGPRLRLDSPSLVRVGGPLLRTLAGHSGGVWTCTVSPDGWLILSAGGDHTARLWDVASGQTLHVLAGHTDVIHACVFSPDGRLVLSASEDQSVRLWHVASGREVARFDADAPLKCCALSPHGWCVVAGDESGTVHFLSAMGIGDLPAHSPLPVVATTATTSSSAPIAASVPEATRPATTVPAAPDGSRDAVRRWWPFGRARDDTRRSSS